MRSIDNLREWWRDRFPVMDRQLGCDFREHIDAIEREVKALADERDLLKTQWEAAVDFDQRLEACAENREDVTLWGVDYTPLPLDADGVPIHVGDVMEWVDIDGEVEVVCTVDAVGVGCFFAWDNANGRFAQKCANAYRHHHAQTVDDMLREFADAWAEWKDGAAMMNPVDTFAAKLRLAGEE